MLKFASNTKKSWPVFVPNFMLQDKLYPLVVSSNLLPEWVLVQSNPTCQSRRSKWAQIGHPIPPAMSIRTMAETKTANVPTEIVNGTGTGNATVKETAATSNASSRSVRNLTVMDEVNETLAQILPRLTLVFIDYYSAGSSSKPPPTSGPYVGDVPPSASASTPSSALAPGTFPEDGGQTEEYRKEGSDWLAQYSSKASKRLLDVQLVHTLNHERSATFFHLNGPILSFFVCLVLCAASVFLPMESISPPVVTAQPRFTTRRPDQKFGQGPL